MKLVRAVLGLTMLWQFAAVAQNGAQLPPAASSQPALSPSVTKENQPMDAIPLRYVEMWNTGDLQPIGTMFTAPAFITFHGQKRLLETGALAKAIMAWRKSMPDLNFKIEDTIVQGDRVAMRLTFSGSYKERLFGDTAAPEAAPRKIHALQMLMFLIRDGKIAEVWDDYDELTMRYQMGALWRSNEQLGACSCKPEPEPTPVPSSSPQP